MTLNSSGDRNRLSGRDFNENNIQIGRYDGTHTVNIAIPSERINDRPLVKAQRKELNALVVSISANGGLESYEIWQKVHAEIGVSSIEEMTVNQYQTAISFLQAFADRDKDKDASRILVSLLLRNSKSNDVRQRLIRYCHVSFGTGRLNDLNRSQLQLALSWLDQQTHEMNKPSLDSIATSRDWISFFRVHKVEISIVFFLGFILGAFIF
ncbi:hypothetical protein GKQ23_15670 [Erwinia sp. E602]|uniref:hypothetical protein n=1 Tax=Erwinia sp. E602 TaxID=2675378 RepID=UPI001BA93612|nr:hypothetical protein [Erwinia sp. E602]QUG76352.1 hypothetical protein GKQ23_15670 [Erwinia sp. E602]